jgi:hypothetical protein
VATHKPLRNIHFEYERAPAAGTGDLGKLALLCRNSGFARLRPIERQTPRQVQVQLRLRRSGLFAKPES